MKELNASAAGTAEAPIEECFELLSDFERYPEWLPDAVRAAQVLERDPSSGRVVKIKTTLHASQGPIQRDFKLHMAVTLSRPELIELRRLPKEPTDREEMLVRWRLAGGASDGTRLAAELTARLDIPAFLPVGGLAQSMADRFLAAALRQLAG